MTLFSKLKSLASLNDLLILIYIVFQIILIMLTGNSARGYLLPFYLASAFFVMIMVLLPKPEKPSLWHFIKTAYPLALIYFFYRISGMQALLLQRKFNDAQLFGIEKNLLGAYSSFALQQIMEIWLNELSYVLYCLGIALPIWLILKLYTERYIRYYENFVLAMVTGCLLCLTIGSLYPTRGPDIALDNYYYLSIVGPWFSIIVPQTMKIIAPSTISFPAIYFCILVIASYYLWDFGYRYVLISFILITGVYWGGVYLRYHYLADGIIAIVIAFLSTSIAGIIYYNKHGSPVVEDGGDP